MTIVELRNKDVSIHAFMEYTEYGPETPGELIIYLNGDMIAIHAQGGSHHTSLYLPIEPLYMEVKSNG